MNTTIFRQNRAFATLLFICMVSVQPVASSTASSLQQPNGGRVLVDASDTVTRAALTRQGATQLVDYGAFSLWRVDAAARARLAQPVAATSNDLDTIYLRDAAINTAAAPPDVPANLRQRASPGRQLWLVQFIGPVQDQWLLDLEAQGLTPVAYMPNNGYVVWGDAAALQRVGNQQGGPINWTGPYHPAYRLAPALRNLHNSDTNGMVDVTVQFYSTAAISQSLAQLRALGGQVYREPEEAVGLTNISLALPTASLETVAGWADVFNIEPWHEPEPMDEAQGQIMAGNLQDGKPSGPGYLNWLRSKGFPTTPTSYPIVDIVDDGLDSGIASNPRHPDFRLEGTGASRIAYINNCTSDPTGNAVENHGTLNAGIVGGYNNRTGSAYEDAQGYQYGLGISPYGRIASTKIFNNRGASDTSRCGNTDRDVVFSSVQGGAAITSNSWGCDQFTASFCSGAPYTASSQMYDLLTRDASSASGGNQQMLHVFSAGNAGSGARTISSPGTAKNVITVGASENVRDNGVVDGCGELNGDTSDDMASFSARGPTRDGRIKPDLVAPGTHIVGPASQDPASNDSGVCGLPPYPDNRYYPTGQTFYTWSSGTSHAAPAVAGAASLIHEYYRRAVQPGQTPSPAMVKALLLNTTRYLTGQSANDTLPSATQGWGGVDLGPLFDTTTRRILVDQTTLLDRTGTTFEAFGTVSDTSKPFAVSLVWTDAPGSTTGNAYVNDLDLEVTVGGKTYRGNVFAGKLSTTGGSADTRNNVEQVLLPPGTAGALSVRVVAANIAGDGVPGNGDTTDQDFALVVSNASNSSTLTPILAAGTVSIDDSAGNGNGVADSGETITVNVPLTNYGNATATGVRGTLTASGGTVLNGSQSYPDLSGGATAVASQPFRVIVSNVPCGTSLSLSFAATFNGSMAPVTAETSLPIGVTPAGTRLAYSFIGAATTIPDNNTGGVVLPIAVPATGHLRDLNVLFNASHPRPADLRVWLTSPSGTLIRLMLNNGGANGTNFTNTVLDDEGKDGTISAARPPFTGSFTPIEALSRLDNEPFNGVWSLTVVDSFASATGSVTGWALDLEADAACQPANQFTAIAITPDRTVIGSPGVTAVITGTSFTPNVLVRWTQGSTEELLTPSRVTTTTVSVDIPARLLQSAGTAQVAVVAPSPDGRVSSPLPFVVSKRSQTITFAPLPNRLSSVGSFNVTATASSGLPVTLSASGGCRIDTTTVTLTGMGSCTITASQAGNEQYDPAPDVSRSFTVGTPFRAFLPVVRR